VTTVALVTGAAGLVGGGVWLGVARAKGSKAAFVLVPKVGGVAGMVGGSW
jgi:hypothetical protein